MMYMAIFCIIIHLTGNYSFIFFFCIDFSNKLLSSYRGSESIIRGLLWYGGLTVSVYFVAVCGKDIIKQCRNFVTLSNGFRWLRKV